jgi:transcriptional antiterminator
MSRTIKELADQLGVSKTTVEKYRKLIPQTLCAKVGGRFVIEDGGINLIISMFNEKTANPKPQTIGAKFAPNFADKFAVEALIKQLEAKDTQITALQKLLDQEQQLHAATKQLLIEAPKEKPFWKFWRKSNE